MPFGNDLDDKSVGKRKNVAQLKAERTSEKDTGLHNKIH